MIIWPDVFINTDISEIENAALCADGLCAWALVMAGNQQPPNFGEVIVKIAIRIGITGTPDSFMEWAKQHGY